MYCPRCDDEVRAVLPWRGHRVLLVVWYVLVALLVLLFPFYAFDYCVLLPSAMLIAVAGGPIHRMAKELPTCARCSLELDVRKGGTGIVPRRR